MRLQTRLPAVVGPFFSEAAGGSEPLTLERIFASDLCIGSLHRIWGSDLGEPGASSARHRG